MKHSSVDVSLSPPWRARDDAPVAAWRVNQLDQVEDGVRKLPVAPGLGQERGPGQLPERLRPKHRDPVNPGDWVWEDGGGQAPELSVYDRDNKFSFRQVFTYNDVDLHVCGNWGTGRNWGRTGTQECRVVFVPGPGHQDIGPQWPGIVISTLRCSVPSSGLSSVFTRINHTWTLIIYWNQLPSFIQSSKPCVVCTELIAQSGACCGQRWEQKEIFSSDSMLATLIYWWSIHTVLIWSTLFYNSTIPRRKELFHKMISFKPCLLCLVCDCVDVTVHVFPEIMSGEWQAVSSSHGPAVATTLGQEWTRVSGVLTRTLSQQAASNDNLSELNISQHF